MKFFKRTSPYPTSGGFSLLELIVVMAVMAILSSILISFSNTSRQQLALYAEQTKLAQAIFRAKSMALTSYVEPSGSTCGFGVHIDYSAMSYFIFSYDKSEISDCQTISSINPALENIVSTFSLNSNVEFVDPAQGIPRMDDVLYIPPEPLALVNSNGTIIQTGSASVVFRTTDGSLSASVSVSPTGLIGF